MTPFKIHCRVARWSFVLLPICPLPPSLPSLPSISLLLIFIPSIDWIICRNRYVRRPVSTHPVTIARKRQGLFIRSSPPTVKVESHRKMGYQEKRAATVFSKDKFTGQKKLKKHAAASEAIIRDASQKISQMKTEVSFHKKERDRESLAGDEAVLLERAMVKNTIILDRKFQSNQLTKLKQHQSSVQSTNSPIISEFYNK